MNTLLGLLPKEELEEMTKHLTVRQNWQMYKSALSKEMCETIISNFSKLEAFDGTTFAASTGNVAVANNRKSKVRWVHNEPHLVELLLHFVHEANDRAFNVDIYHEMSEMQFTEYQASYGGKYDWHHDVNWVNDKNYDRKLSMVVQLSEPDAYEGGTFEFNEVENPIAEDWMQQGSILIFPSYLRHRVTEVTKGVRYSLVSWVRGPRWR